MKILIIAAPKSASTSLMRALSNVTGLTAKQEYFFSKGQKEKDFNFLARIFQKIFKSLHVVHVRHMESKKIRHIFPTHEFSLLSKFHSDIGDFNLNINLDDLLKHDIHKQHFPPTQNNLAILKKTKKVILCRSSCQIVESYLREKPTEELLYLQEKIKNDSSFKESLTGELDSWREKWTDAEKDNENSLIINYEELIQNPSVIINSILKFYEIDIKVHSNYNLPKERFSNKNEKTKAN